MLTEEFVAVALDTHALQQLRSPAGDWFMELARANVERVREGHTAQGFYALSAGGAFLGFRNNRSVERVHELLDKGRRAYLALEQETVNVDAEQIAAPFAPRPPDDAAVALVYTRIQPFPEGAGASNRYLGRDRMWILREELDTLLTSTDQQVALPRALAMRLARFHLVDNVRGEPPMWSERDVHTLAVTTTRRGDSLELAGTFDLHTADGERGYVGTLTGRIAFDAATRSLREWTVLAEGEAWGEGRWTAGAPEGRFPLAVALVLPAADDVLARAIPPQAAACGFDYVSSK